jgi:hypothetical protein
MIRTIYKLNKYTGLDLNDIFFSSLHFQFIMDHNSSDKIRKIVVIPGNILLYCKLFDNYKNELFLNIGILIKEEIVNHQ